MRQSLWHLAKFSLFEKLAPSQLAALEKTARMKGFRRGEQVYAPADAGDAALLVASGRIRLSSITPDGKQAILAYVEPGELFGELSVIGSQHREEFAEALIPSTVISIPAQALQAVMESSPELAIGVVKLIGLRRLRIERRLKSLLFRSHRDRLLHLLLELAEQYGEPQSQGMRLKIKLSHQDLASIIGATRETVTTTLGELQDAGVVTVDRRVITLRSIAETKSLIQSDL